MLSLNQIMLKLEITSKIVKKEPAVINDLRSTVNPRLSAQYCLSTHVTAM